MRYLLDTDVCIEAMHAREPVYSRLLKCYPEDLAIASMTEAELWFGAHNSGRPAYNRALTEAFLSAYPDVLPFDSEAARAHADIRYALRAQRISDRDMVIASVALVRGMTVATGNVREFSRVPGLKVENWTIR